MAMVIYKAPHEQRSGKQKGSIYRSDQCGEHLQADPRKVNSEPSEKQRKVRKSFYECIHRYFHTLTETHRKKWWIWSSNHPQKNKKGEVRFLQAHNAYSHINIPRRQEGKDFIDDPYNI